MHDARGTNDIDVNVSADAEQPAAVFAALPSGIVWSDEDVLAHTP